jgi:hypothetical protein
LAALAVVGAVAIAGYGTLMARTDNYHAESAPSVTSGERKTSRARRDRARAGRTKRGGSSRAPSPSLARARSPRAR